MATRVDTILRELIEAACEEVHLGRTPRIRDQTTVLAKILTTLESKGDAMRYLDADGRIAWKATPQVRFQRRKQRDSPSDRDRSLLQRIMSTQSRLLQDGCS